jgi:PmbA protein
MMNDGKLLDLAKFAAQVATKSGAKDASANVFRAREVEVEWRDGKLDRIRESTKQGLGITLFVDGRYSSNATSDIRNEAVEAYIKQAVATTKYLAADEHRHLPDPSRYQGMTTIDLQRKDPNVGAVTPEDRLAMAKRLEDATRAADEKKILISVTTTVGDTEEKSATFNTNGFEGEEESSTSWQVAVASSRMRVTASRRAIVTV